jgi:hypothetical protein
MIQWLRFGKRIKSAMCNHIVTTFPNFVDGGFYGQVPNVVGVVAEVFQTALVSAVPLSFFAASS